jgi:predicted acylesterase/phospholipase RssA
MHKSSEQIDVWRNWTSLPSGLEESRRLRLHDARDRGEDRVMSTLAHARTFATRPFVPKNELGPASRDSAGRRPATAFVLSGGASLGALQVGMLRALYERGVVPDFMIGTSVGALNATFVASRPQTVETIDELAAVWRGLRREQVFPVRWRELVLGLVGRGDHVVSDRGVREIVSRI